jgi:hypothetical protein
MAGWSIPLDKLAAKVQLDIETVARKATLQVFTAVVKKSPVDTGRFRANWNVSFGVPDTSVTSSTDTARADSEVDKVQALPVGGVVYLSNSLPYAQVLEYGGYPNPPKHPTGKTKGGYSTQAPQGMARLSALEFNDFVRKAISE